MNARERLMLIAAIVMLGAVCFKFVVYDPQQAAYAQLAQTRDAAAQELARNRQVAGRAAAVHKEYARLSAFIATVEAKLPPTKEIPALLTAMEQFTRKLGITLDSIQPGALQPVVPGAAGGSSQPSRAPTATTAGGKAVPYSRMEVHLGLTGTFVQVVRYLHDLRDFPRLIIVDSISLGPKTLPKLGVSVTAELYTMGGPAAAPAPGAQSAPVTPAGPPKTGAPAAALPSAVPPDAPLSTPRPLPAPNVPGAPGAPAGGGHGQ
jgi:Tfp pilus assembly protein PilO